MYMLKGVHSNFTSVTLYIEFLEVEYSLLLLNSTMNKVNILKTKEEKLMFNTYFRLL